MLKLLYSLPLALVLGCLGACSGGGHDDGPADVSDDDFFTTPDLALFELNGHVRNAEILTYYKVEVAGDSIAVDTVASMVSETVIYFDSLGNYVPRRDERIKRDDQGRMTRWEDHRPNLRRIHGGYLKDTLTYRYDSPYVMCSSGMGDYAVTVYDHAHRVVGQYTDPLGDVGEQAAVFNIYREDDERGNWIERLSVWTTQAPGERPHVSYTLTRRIIRYY